jgi:hypothetical protein
MAFGDQFMIVYAELEVGTCANTVGQKTSIFNIHL